VAGRTFSEAAAVAGKVIAGSPQAITRSLPTMALSPDEFKRRAVEMGSRAEALFSMIEERFEGFAKKSAQTSKGIASNIKDSFFVIMSEVGEGSLGPIRAVLQATMDWLEKIRASPARLSEVQSQLRVVAQNMVNFANAIRGAFGAVKDFLGPFGTMRGALALVATILGMKLIGAIWGMY